MTDQTKYEVEDIPRHTKIVKTGSEWSAHFGWVEWEAIKAGHYRRYVVREVPCGI